MEGKRPPKLLPPAATHTGSTDLKEAPVLQTAVRFHAARSDVRFGESIHIVGSHPSLGAWDPSKGLALITNEEIFPCWISQRPILIDLHELVEYKYIIVGNDGVLRAWEEHVGNRSFVAAGEEMTIEDDEGLYRQHWNDAVEKEDAGEVPHIQVRFNEFPIRGKEEKLAFIRDLEGHVTIDDNDTLFIVAYQLPIKVHRLEGGGWTVDESAPNDGRNFAMLPLVKELREKWRRKVLCVGWPGVHVENMKERNELERKLMEHGCIPVFPPRQEFDKYVNFCTTFLWPVFHDVMLFFQTSNPRPFDEQGFAAYSHINNKYAAALIPHTHENDLIWVHDYHLLMTPTFITRRLHRANIGFYLHTPFPSSDSFKSLPRREELIAGMMCADQLGFQFFAYARNFFISVKRIHGIDPVFRPGGFMGLDYNGRFIMIKVSHFVYPFQDTQRVVNSDIVQQKAEEVKALFRGKIVFANMDRCDGLSGLVPKLRAFKRFLVERPEHRGKAVLVQYCFESTAGYGSTSDLVKSLEGSADAFLQTDAEGRLRIAARGDGAAGRASESACDGCDILLRFEKVDRLDRLALFRAADVLLDTCVKAGLNLMPFEFISAHHDDEEKPSVVICSEFSGCSRVLAGCIRINPWNTTEVVNACDKAITMAENEKREWAQANFAYVSENAPMSWFEDFLTDLRRARKKEGLRIESIGFGAKMRQWCIGQDFQKLPVDAVLAGYRNSKNRLILLDNEGTLSADKRHLDRQYGAPKGEVDDLNSRGTAPDEAVLQSLRRLCDDTRNTVVILSGRNREMMEEWFGSVRGLGLAAERGFYYKVPVVTGDTWHCMLMKPDFTWKSLCFEIMKMFVKRTQGSFIENKGSALVWQYRDADQHFGSWQAKELSSHLKDLLFGFEVDVIDGKGYVEVSLQGVNKGVAVTKVLQKIQTTFGDVDFVLAIGDDRSDEDMFEAVNAFVDPGEAFPEETSSQMSTTDYESDPHSEGDRGGLLIGNKSSAIAAPSSGDVVVGRVSSDSFTAQAGGTTGPGSGERASSSGALVSRSRPDRRLKSMQGGLGSGMGSLASKGDLRAMGGNSCNSDDFASMSGNMNRRFFTCTVVRKPSAAKFFLDDVEEVTELLGSLRSQGERRSSTNEPPPSAYTWSSGTNFKDSKSLRAGSMPALSSLAFIPRSRES